MQYALVLLALVAPLAAAAPARDNSLTARDDIAARAVFYDFNGNSHEIEDDEVISYNDGGNGGNEATKRETSIAGLNGRDALAQRWGCKVCWSCKRGGCCVGICCG